MRSRRARAAVIGTLAIAACAPAMMSSDTAATEAVVRARSAAYQAAVASRNAEAVGAMFAPEGSLMAPGGPAMQGREAVTAGWRELFGMQNLSLQWTPTRLDVAASGDLATESGTWTMSFNTPNGPMNDRGSYTTVWRKFGNDWLIVSDAVVSAMPPAPPVTVSVTFDTGATEMIGASGVNWMPLEVPGFPAGASIAVLHGNPAGEGDYTIRLRFPNGYRVPVHWHPKGEHVSVLSGTFHFAMSGDASTATHPHGPGDFLYLPPRMPHHGRMEGETVLQLHGMGPFAINLGTP